jgi:hypothetical protein
LLVKTAHQDTTEQISNPPELRCEQECNRKRRRSYDRCSTSFLQLQRNANTLSQAQIASELKFSAAAWDRSPATGRGSAPSRLVLLPPTTENLPRRTSTSTSTSI